MATSAYSDDGNRNHRLQYDLNQQINEIPEPDTGVSITAELSDHRQRDERPDEDDPIYEQPEESENASSPPGSIGQQHDIKSENIKTTVKKFGKVNNKPMSKQENLSDEGVSREAHKSEATKVSAVAVVSPPLPVPETSRSIQNFYVIYDHLFAEFKDELTQEYAQMRGCYMGEYQENYEQNTSRKEDKIGEMNQAIQAQCDYIKELYAVKAMKQELMRRFYVRNQDYYIKKKVFAQFKYNFEVYKRNKYMEMQVVRVYRQKKLQRIFDAVRNFSHNQFVKKLGTREEDFRAELESTILVQYRNKVDSLLLYAAELEDKIKLEQDAREKMTKLYDQSLSQGFQVLNQETSCLAPTQVVPAEVLIQRHGD